uniref:Transmembrane protein n=1 Tax=viral metagenome TaxID=1070528 RepID=A0A6C0H4M2_9ZZZZ
MATTNENILNKINNYFDNSNYGELYSNDIWFTIIIFLVVIFIALYFYILGSIKSNKSSWQQNKCNPILMPFASLINSEESKGNEMDFIINNFNECLNILNAELANETKKPIDNMKQSVEGIFGSVYNGFIELQKFIAYLFNLILELFKLIMDKLSVILINIKLFFMNANEFLRKIISSITVVFYTLVLLIKAFRLIFVLFVFGWLLTMVIPASMTVVGLIIVLITVVIMFLQMSSIPVVGLFLALILLFVIIIYYVGFLVALIFLIVVCLMYGLFSRFVQKIFPK